MEKDGQEYVCDCPECHKHTGQLSMPPVFPSGACGQVRPSGATLPTAARRAPSLVKPRTAVSHGNTAFQDCRILPQGQAAATPAWTCADLDLNVRCDAGHILQPQETRTTRTAFPRTPTNTKKSLRTISRLKTLSKHGGFLLSHLVWQYHRR